MSMPATRAPARVACATIVGVILVTSLSAANAPTNRYAQGPPGVVLDQVTRLYWQQDTPSGQQTQAGAVSYCKTLSLSGGGGGGWRLPTVGELETILDFTQTQAPFIDHAWLPNTESDWYWSSTSLFGETTSGWNVNFGEAGGNVALYFPSAQMGYVRCVK